jgi:type VI secretion system protein ImpG
MSQRILTEFFAFPEKFQFIDFHFARLLRAAGTCRKLTLHIAVANVLKESSVARDGDASGRQSAALLHARRQPV